ncbi:hypothetical protein ABZ793_28300 [Micromonospora sp. NPDC047465]|uniref:hypothetical protein n=1 Tax=Micromonospora sp. NPDC047465 TaxID=3154813 RepID=UPI0033E51C67
MEIILALLPHLVGLRLEAVVVRGIGVRIDAATRTVRAAYVACGAWSTTMHDRYVRRLADIRLGGHEVLVALTVRRFTCVNSNCRRRTFVEQVPGLTRGGMRVTRCRRRVIWRRSRWRWVVGRAAGWRIGWRCRCRG